MYHDPLVPILVTHFCLVWPLLFEGCADPRQVSTGDSCVQILKLHTHKHILLHAAKEGFCLRLVADLTRTGFKFVCHACPDCRLHAVCHPSSAFSTLHKYACFCKTNTTQVNLLLSYHRTHTSTSNTGLKNTATLSTFFQ